jgi:flagellar secretion chaperone FliS
MVERPHGWSPTTESRGPRSMLDPTAAYRTSQVVSASRAGQIVLLYQGAIRFGAQHLAFLERRDIEQAHRASIRCQEIVTALRGSLDLSAGPIAAHLDDLYDFVLRRLAAGNAAKDPRPTEEALEVLRGLLDAWQELASRPASNMADNAAASLMAPSERPAMARPALVGAGTYAAGGARR